MRRIAIALAVALAPAWAMAVSGNNVQDITSTGTTVWPCPANVTTVIVELWAGGGGGGAANTDTTSKGGGGAGGTYVKKTVTVSTGNYNVIVGVAGTAGSSSNGTAGGDSTFNATDAVAKGGAPGLYDLNGGTGGSGTCTGSTPSTTSGTSVCNAGGNGSTGGVGSATGGAGGGGAGSGGAGSNASGNTQGGATSQYGGAGGAGRTTAGTGNAGSSATDNYGGGGGAGYATTSTNRGGGAGRQGRARLSWYEPPPPGPVFALLTSHAAATQTNTTASVTVHANTLAIIHAGYQDSGSNTVSTVAFAGHSATYRTRQSTGAAVGAEIWTWCNTGADATGTAVADYGTGHAPYSIVQVIEATGVACGSEIGTIATPTTGTTSAGFTVSLTTAAEDSRVFAAFSTNASVGASAGNGTTTIPTSGEQADGNGNAHIIAWDNQNEAITTSYTVSVTGGGGNTIWAGVAIEVKSAPAPQTYTETFTETGTATDSWVAPGFGPTTYTETFTETGTATDSLADGLIAVTPQLDGGFPVCAYLATGATASTITLNFTPGAGPRQFVVGSAFYTGGGTDPTPVTVAWSGGTPSGATGWTRKTEPNDGTIHWWAGMDAASATTSIGAQTVTVVRSHATDQTDGLACVWSYSNSNGVAAATDHHSPMSDVTLNRVHKVDITITATKAHSVLLAVATGGELCDDSNGSYGNFTPFVVESTTTSINGKDCVYGGGLATFKLTNSTSAPGAYTFGLDQVGTPSGTTWYSSYYGTQLNRAFAVEGIEVMGPAIVTTITESYTETAAGGDSFADHAAYVSTVVESAVAGDSTALSAIFVHAFSETVAALDALADDLTAGGGGTTYAESFTEGASAADSIASAWTMVHAFTEAGAASDALVPLSIYIEAFTDAVNAADALVTQMTMLHAITETAVSDASLASAWTMIHTLQETATALDALSTGSPFPTVDYQEQIDALNVRIQALEDKLKALGGGTLRNGGTLR